MKALLLALYFVALPALAQFKCTGPDGRVAFQAQPCERDAKAQRLDLPKPAPDDGRAEFRALAARRVFAIGMTRAEVDQAMSIRPEVTRSWVAGIEWHHLTYRFSDRTTYITMRDGIMESFTEQPRGHFRGQNY